MSRDALHKDEPLSQVLQALRDGLQTVLGDQFGAMYLFGSRARGEARADSDIDILVVVNGDVDYGDLIDRTSLLVSAISLQHDVVISRAFVSREQYENEQSPFLLSVRREGMPV